MKSLFSTKLRVNLLWHLSNEARLGASAKRILDDPGTLLIVPVLVLAETKHAADRKRLPIAFERVLQAVLASPRITVFPMDLYTEVSGYDRFDSRTCA